MNDWIAENKGAGPWSFAKQEKKIGYLNNPRWTDLLTGKQQSDLMVWNPNQSPMSSGNSVKHFPCGYWFNDGPSPPSPPPPSPSPPPPSLLPSGLQSISVLKSENVIGMGAVPEPEGFFLVTGFISEDESPPLYENVFAWEE